jgi:hypothetical protein
MTRTRIRSEAVRLMFLLSAIAGMALALGAERKWW